MPVAILDFGTNTFNLLIAEKREQGFSILYSGKEPAKLGKGGIGKGVITNDAMARGLTAIENHMRVIKKYGVSNIHAFATSAFRNAENGKEFAQQITKLFGFEVSIIDGKEEASLIYEGIRESVDFGSEKALIIDIGGGSIEFIICNSEKILWKESFEIGMARIIELFKLSDPVTSKDIRDLESFYKEGLTSLSNQVKQYKPSMLVGASGSFDTLAAMVQHHYGPEKSTSGSLKIKIDQYNHIHNLLIHSTAAERMLMPGMEPVRVDMIVPATIFINFVYNYFSLKTFIQSEYALKEGAFVRLIS